jgi:DNA-binding CsgD family transcriptional regulator
VRRALDDLRELSLLRLFQDDPHRLRPVFPAVALELLLSRRQADLQREQHRLDEGRMALQGLVAELARGRSAGGAGEELVGIDAVRERLERLAYETRRDVRTFGPGGAQTAESIRASEPLNRYLLGKGVRMRTVYLDSARNDPSTSTYARRLADLGAEVRTVPVLPVRMLIVDDTYAVVPLDPDDSSVGACLLRSPGAIAAVTALFDHVWRGASAWGQRAEPSPNSTSHSLSDQDRAVLYLLVLGNTDEQVGRRLGVSTRTAGRIAADLMTRLRARSRFQAGALAAARGWITPATGTADADCPQ